MDAPNQTFDNKAFDPEVILTSYQTFDPEEDAEVWFTQRPKSSFQLIWKNVSRTVKVSNGFFSKKTTKKTILEPMNGIIEGGTITALMGPSGAGKTTLLKIIANKLSCDSSTGAKGEAYIRHNLTRQEAKSFRIGYVPQNDQLFTEFTVKETLMFASKMTNGHLTIKAHELAVKEILTKLDLLEKANTVISKLSGGQVKRASIGVELMAFPEILILDEPTSGLDSDTSEKVITLLRNLVQKPLNLNDAPAVLCTIHQPSKDVFFLFDNIFLLSRTGQNIYYGTPQGVKRYLNSYGYSSKKNTNPAEHMIEFANGKHGNSSFNEMSSQTYGSTFSLISQNRVKSRTRRFSSVYNELPVEDMRMKTSTTFLAQVFLLFHRSFKKHTTKSWWTLYKIVAGLIVAALLFNMSKKPFGEITGCWDTFKIFTTPKNGTLGKSSLAKLRTSDNFNFNLLGMFTSIKHGTSFAYLTLQYEMMFYATTIVFVFPFEIKTHLKEMSNSWYSPLSFFVSQSLSSAATHFMATLPMFIFTYWISHQPLDYWIRPVAAFLVIYSFGLIWETKAEAVCLLMSSLPHTISIAVVIANFFPALFLSGFNVRYIDMWSVLQPLSRLNDVTNAFEANMIATYGIDRCLAVDHNSTVGVQAQEINMKRIVGTLWSSFGSKRTDTQTWAFLLGQSENYLYPVVDALTEFFKIPLNSESETQSNRGQSFMLDFYDVKDSTFLSNAIVLVSTLVVCKLSVYILLKMRTSSKHE